MDGGADVGGEAAKPPRIDRETMNSRYALARGLMPDESPRRDHVEGYRLVRVEERTTSWLDVRVRHDGYAVLGAHDRCDLALLGDAAVWLRHLVAICVRLDGRGVGLRLIDLQTDLPFFLDDDIPRWSVLVSGPFAMRLGHHVVCGFPLGSAEGEAEGNERRLTRTRGAAATPNLVATTGELDTEVLRAVEAHPKSTAPSEFPVALESERRNYRVTAPVSQIQHRVLPDTFQERIRVTLERRGKGVSVELPGEVLDTGVLLGRALNCLDGGLRRIFCEAISRVHVLLLRDRADVYAFDLCSTNGTRVGGQRIRRYRLDDGGTTLELGKKVTFRWHR